MPYNNSTKKNVKRPKKKKRSLINFMKAKATGTARTSIYMDPKKRAYLKEVGK